MSRSRNDFEPPSPGLARASRAPLRAESEIRPNEGSGRPPDSAAPSAVWIDRCAHDLRGVLSAADGYGQMLELGLFGPVPDNQAREIARIRSLLGKAFGIIEEIEEQVRHRIPA
jgi:hypothetical protein